MICVSRHLHPQAMSVQQATGEGLVSGHPLSDVDVRGAVGQAQGSCGVVKHAYHTSSCIHLRIDA